MNKDVIYIDTEDDITAIIGKIKDSKEKIVALVPPKRIGVLQSAVNLRLLTRMAEENHKRLVLVTNNKALVNLSSVANIPVAKSLQSKPEIMEISDLLDNDGDDVIEGEKLSVGELMKTADESFDIKITPEKKESVNDIINEIDIDKDIPKNASDINEKTIELPTSKKIKVPDFVKFRTFLFIGIVGLIGLAGFLYWAIVYAPAAEVIVSAKTEDESVSLTVKLTNETNIEASTIKITPKEIKKDLSVTFDATGEKNTGNRATGIVTIKNCDTTGSFTIDAGTIFTSDSGKNYTSDASVEVPGFTGESSSKCRWLGTGAGMIDVAVSAVAPGEGYNIGESSYDISDIDGDIYAYGGDMTGGTTKISPVVTTEDIEKATISLKALSTDSVKQQLIKQVTEEEFVVNESYEVVYGEFISTPAIDEESTGKAILKSSTNFKISSIAKSDLISYLDATLNKKINPTSEKIYDNGIDGVKLSGYLSNAEGVTLRITASGKIGPNLSEDLIINAIKGKKFGDAQSTILEMPGVSDVEINFSYFWVKTIPNKVEEIDIQFILDDNQND